MSTSAEDLPAHSAKLVAELTRDELVALVSGRDAWTTQPVTRLGLGSVRTTDGPVGARGAGSPGSRSVCLPASLAVAASFDPGLATDVGALIGLDAVRKGAQVLLAPTVNLARHPLGGRNFESFGEDPRLTALMAVAFVDGVQGRGVAACGKHLVANDIEYARMDVSSEVPMDVLRENYLLPFEAMAEAAVGCFMAAYPRLDGTFCSEHHWLLTELVRDEWGFDGLIMSDWGATHHTVRSLEAGLDLEMPGPPRWFGSRLRAAVDTGAIDEAVVAERAGRLVQLAGRVGRLAGVAPGSGADGAAAPTAAAATGEAAERSVDDPAERALARRAATEGMVLLRNRHLLPLETVPGRVAVLGPNADPGVIQGGGSAQVNAHRAVSPLAGLTEALPDSEIVHHRGVRAHRYLPVPADDEWVEPLTLERFGGAELDGGVVARGTARRIGWFGQRRPNDEVGSQRWTGRLRLSGSGGHQFSVLATGRSRVMVDGELVADNWTDPRPSDALFGFGSSERFGEVVRDDGAEVEVVVEWSRADHPLIGLRFGHLPPGDPGAELDEAVAAAAGADLAVVVVGLDHEWETEGHDRVMFGLPGDQAELITRVSAANPNTVVVVNAGGPVDAEAWIDDPGAVLMAWYGGQEMGGALADVITGRAEPGGRLPVTWPRRIEDAPFELPRLDPGPVPAGLTLDYRVDGHLVGGRSYRRRGVGPLAPFGYGLGYTSFTVRDTRIDPGVVRSAVDAGPTTEAARVVVAITNTGDRPGKAVVQVYLEPPDGGAADPTPGDGGPAVELAPSTWPRPDRVFVGADVVRLDPGATGSVTVPVPARALARWADGWRDVPGPHQLLVGWSSADLEPVGPINWPVVDDDER
ncbi:MAG: glycoside hydrolase family 3 C-terminal domain-containing protein [Acidimicrobiales bacterium]